MQRAIADAAGVHDVGSKIVNNRAKVAVDFQSIRRRQRIDAAKFQNPLHSVRKSAENGQQVGNDDVVTLPGRLENFPARKNSGDIAEPALQHFDVNAESERVQSADLDVLAPMRGGIRIEKRAVETL